MDILKNVYVFIKLNYYKITDVKGWAIDLSQSIIHWLLFIIHLTMRCCRNRTLTFVSCFVDCSLLSHGIFHPSLGTMYVGLILVQVLVLNHPAAGYNLDQENSLVFSGPPSTMFGYSVLLHHHTTHSWSVIILIYNFYSPFLFTDTPFLPGVATEWAFTLGC